MKTLYITRDGAVEMLVCDDYKEIKTPSDLLPETIRINREFAEPISREQFINMIRTFDRYAKIPAIKFVRTFTGLGLKEAKDVVEYAWELTQ